MRLREKTNKQLKLLLIETHLRCGYYSDEFQAVREALFARGFSREDIVHLLVASRLYESAEKFYAKHDPQMV